MTPFSYVRDRILTIAVALLCAFSIASVLLVLEAGIDAAILVSCFVVACFALVLVIDYLRRRSFYKELEGTVEHLKRVYYAAEILERPEFLEGKITFDALESLGRAAANDIAAHQQQVSNYRDYIELWIHEIKTPIAAAHLMTASLHDSDAAKLKVELARIEQQVEQALFYARSTSLARDYAIREIVLAAVLRDACKKHARYLIEYNTTPHICIGDTKTVFADSSWLVFILGQIMVNSAKYGASAITFSAHEKTRGTRAVGTVLEIADNGLGIPAADVPRVFDRGFTGENGRAQGSATGMGLYLVATLCQRMNLKVAIVSEQGEGTRVLITFPHDRTSQDYLSA